MYTYIYIFFSLFLDNIFALKILFWTASHFTTLIFFFVSVVKKKKFHVEFRITVRIGLFLFLNIFFLILNEDSNSKSETRFFSDARVVFTV